LKKAIRAAAVAAAVLLVSVPTAAAQNVGPDHVASDNVELVGRVKTVGDGVGAKIVGDILYVTSSAGLNLFDIKEPDNPQLLGVFNADVHWENEEVPTNGKILGISAEIGCRDVTAMSANCINLYDVSDPANIRFIKSVADAGEHTSACIFDCAYFLGDGGTVTDARDPENAEVIGQWDDDLEGVIEGGCHHVREVAPGIVLGSCRPVVLLSFRPEDGATPVKPKVLATGDSGRNTLIHSSRWPREGRDRWMLVGEETNAHPECDDTAAAFMTFDATRVLDPFGGWNVGSAFTKTDEIRPENGSYADGKTPYNGLGCSVHWFMEHPKFRNGGIVAVAEYEAGTRFYQVAADGKLTEQGYFLPLHGSTSAPHWHPKGEYLYAIDYTRGIDILRWTGEDYVPGGADDPGAKPGTNAPRQTGDGAPCASAAGFRDTRASGAGSGVQFTITRREERPFSIDVFQQSAGRTIVGERLVARFSNLSDSFTWDGADRKGRRLADGRYFARLTMQTSAGRKDVRRLTLERKGGRFRTAPDFHQRIDCGELSGFKLSSSVFGGRSGKALGISYSLARGAESVKLEALVGKRVVKRFKASPTAGRTHRFTLPARLVARGSQVRVRATVKVNKSRSVSSVFAKRL
jgi:hypothetical protein